MATLDHTNLGFRSPPCNMYDAPLTLVNLANALVDVLYILQVAGLLNVQS